MATKRKTMVNDDNTVEVEWTEALRPERGVFENLRFRSDVAKA